MRFLGIIAILGLSLVVMVLWNLLVPDILGLSTINFWQAAGLFLLGRLLFGSFNIGDPRNRNVHDFKRDNAIREKWMKMSEEERNDFISKRREFFHSHSFSDDHFSGHTKQTSEE